MSEGVTPGGPRQSNDRLLPSNFVLILSVVYTCTSTCWFCFMEWNGMEWRKFYWRESLFLIILSQLYFFDMFLFCLYCSDIDVKYI